MKTTHTALETVETAKVSADVFGESPVISTPAALQSVVFIGSPQPFIRTGRSPKIGCDTRPQHLD